MSLLGTKSLAIVIPTRKGDGVVGSVGRGQTEERSFLAGAELVPTKTLEDGAPAVAPSAGKRRLRFCKAYTT